VAVYALIRMRSSLPERYQQAGLMTVCLTLTSLLYFYGRSHENNLVNLAGILLFCLVLLFDLLARALESPRNRTRTILNILPPIAMLLIFSVAYSGPMTERFTKQVSILLGRATPGGWYEPPLDCEEIARHVRDPSKVFYFTFADYRFYLTCGQTPPGFYQPLHAHVLRSKLHDHLRTLTANGYDIVVPLEAIPFFRENVGSSIGWVEESRSAKYLYVRPSREPARANR
jgi:hypothetical protein